LRRNTRKEQRTLFDGHRSDDYHIYIFVTTDYGENWKAFTMGLRIRPGASRGRNIPNQNLLGRSSDYGYRGTGGAKWDAFKNNFPTRAGDDIEIQAREERPGAGNARPSIWIFDDLTPVEKMEPASGSDITFFCSASATTCICAIGAGARGRRSSRERTALRRRFSIIT